jgi:hypothetical protein
MNNSDIQLMTWYMGNIIIVNNVVYNLLINEPIYLGEKSIGIFLGKYFLRI